MKTFWKLLSLVKSYLIIFFDSFARSPKEFQLDEFLTKTSNDYTIKNFTDSYKYDTNYSKQSSKSDFQSAN
jgi:hypothetical protein